MSMASLCSRPETWCSSIVRVSSCSTIFSITLSTLGFFFDFASTSPTSVRGESSDCSTKYLAVVVGEDDGPVGRERRQPAGVIEVRVRVHDVLDSFVRDQPLGLCDHGQCARLALPALEHDDVIFELDGERHVAAGDAIDTVGQLLRGGRPCHRRSDRRRRRRRHQRREVRRIGASLPNESDVRFHADAALPDPGGRPEAAAEVRVVTVKGLDMHVAEYGMLDPRLDALDELLRVDVADDSIRLA